MLIGLKNFVNEANRIIKIESRKINELHKEIDNYETLIYVVGKTGATNEVIYCREKINECYAKIDRCLEKINNSRDRIATMKAVDKVIRGGEKCA